MFRHVQAWSGPFHLNLVVTFVGHFPHCTHTHLVIFGGATTAAVNTSLGCPGAPIDLLYLPRFFGEGGCGRPREKVALLLAGRTESLRGLMGGGGGWGSDTLGLRFLRLSSIMTQVGRGLSAAQWGRCPGTSREEVLDRL